MKSVIELNQICYYFKEKEYPNEDKLLFIKEQSDGETRWIIKKGWEYSLWYTIGERAGMAEAEEILMWDNGEARYISIEEYVRFYRQVIQNAISAYHLFDQFSVKLKGWRDKENCADYMIKKIEKDYRLPPIKEEDGRIYYEKDITTIEDLMMLPFESGYKQEFQIYMEFTEKEQ